MSSSSSYDSDVQVIKERYQDPDYDYELLEEGEDPIYQYTIKASSHIRGISSSNVDVILGENEMDKLIQMLLGPRPDGTLPLNEYSDTALASCSIIRSADVVFILFEASVGQFNISVHRKALLHAINHPITK